MVVVDVASRLVITDVASLLTLPWPINTPREPPGNPNVSPPYLNLPISFYLSQAIKTAVGSSPMSRRYRPPPGPCSSSGGASRRLDHSGGEEDRGELRVGLILPFPFSDVHRISVPWAHLRQQSSPSTIYEASGWEYASPAPFNLS
jgi:hypothetical protein